MFKKKRKVIVIILIITAALGGFFTWRQTGKKAMSESQNLVNTATVTKGNITSELKASGTLAAKNTYKIASMVEGEILSANFSEGDQVEKGQILYEIDKSGMESELSGAKNSLDRNAGTLEQAKNYSRIPPRSTGEIPIKHKVRAILRSCISKQVLKWIRAQKLLTYIVTES